MTSWDRKDLARIRAVLDELDQALAAQEQEQERDKPAGGGEEGRRRLGRGSLEAKLIRGFGPLPVLPLQIRGATRSVYVGKARSGP